MSNLFSVDHDGNDWYLSAPTLSVPYMLDDCIVEALIRVTGLFSETLGASIQAQKHKLELGKDPT